MPAPPAPLWRGRILALLGIVLASISVRVGVSSLSPLVGHIQADIDLPVAVVGVIGAAPPVSFAVLGLVTPLIERRLGLVPTMVLSLVMITAGLVVRAVAPDAAVLLLGSLLLFAGGGTGNVLLPPLVKRYFPDRIGLMMTLYTLMMAASSFGPATVAVPIADGLDWRFSLGVWTFLVVATLVPWTVLMLRGRAEARQRSGSVPAASAPGPTAGDRGGEGDRTGVLARVLRVPLTWAMTAGYAASATTGYVAFAWLPIMVAERAGVDPAVAGLLLAVYGATSVPWTLLVPTLVVRRQAARPLYLIAAGGGLAGLAGYLLAPQPELVLLWTILYGFTGGLFPLGLVLISLRSRTGPVAVALSGVVQGTGFAVAAIAVMAWGLMREATGSWTLPLVVLLVFLVCALPVGWMISRPTTIEDDWEARHGRSW